MDGISFCVGLSSKDLRGKQLKDLIYRASSDKGDEERSAYVAMVYERDGKKLVFKRSITAAVLAALLFYNREAFAEHLRVVAAKEVPLLFRAYFGAEIALYVFFVSHYKFMMMPSGVIGVIMAFCRMAFVGGSGVLLNGEHGGIPLTN